MTTEPAPTSTAIIEHPGIPPAAAADTPAAPPPAAAPPGPPPTWPLKADFVILALLLILSFFLASFTATNSELWTHLAVGKRLSEGKFEFGVDPYSWATEATADQPAVYWVHHSWLYSWLVYQLYLLAGGAGLIIGKAILFTAAIGLLCRIGWTEANRWFVLICLVMAVLAASHLLLMQPIVVSLFFLALTLYLLHRAGVFAVKGAEPVPDGAIYLWCLPPLFALWANLDSFFILGPIVLALCWAGTGLAHWFPNGNPVSGKTIGLVLGVSLLACLLNPHHIHVFELPPELAYLVLSVTDGLGISLPDALIAGGRTVKELRKADVNALWTISPLAPDYFSNKNLGMSIAGMAFYPLVMLGLLSFTLITLLKPQPNAPTLQVNRFLLWLVFGVFALALHRMIPYFVMIAAPLTALTLGEFLAWQQSSNEIAPEGRDRGLHMARFASIPFLLVMLFLAWPGWLHGTYEYYSPHRVAWDIRPNPSLRQAALTLNTLQERGECGNVFNAGFDLGDYLPWFAPDVKYFMDTRFSLFPRQAAVYAKAREALIDPNKDAAAWQTLFEERKIRQAALVGLLTSGKVETFWFDPDQWRQRYGDTRVMVFSRQGLNQPWPPNTARADWNRLAFGVVAPDRRPPAKGTASPQIVGDWTNYLEGIQPTPAATGECEAQKAYFFFKSNLRSPCLLLRQTQMLSASLATLQGIPGDAASLPHAFASITSLLVIRSADGGPPALPILMVRSGRRAVAENRQDGGSHIALRDANEISRQLQEDYWIHFQRGRFPHPSGLRDRVRQLQLIVGTYNGAVLQPDNLQLQLQMADYYMQPEQNMLDLALDHMILAQKAIVERLTSKNGPKNPNDRERALARFQKESVEPLEEAIRTSTAKFKDKSDKKPLEQAAYAVRGSYKELQGDKTVNRPIGLGKKAYDLLVEIDVKSLKDKQERMFYFDLFFELLLKMGRVDILAKILPELKDALPPAPFAHYQVLVAAALGDYDTMDEALPVLEKAHRDNLKALQAQANFRRALWVPGRFAVPVSGWAAPLTSFAMTEIYHQHNGTIDIRNQYNELYNAMTLRGIAALEAGNTKHARQLFEATLKEAGDDHAFSDRPIARRYLDLLNEQKQ